MSVVSHSKRGRVRSTTIKIRLNWTCPRSWTDASIEVKIKQFNDEVLNALDISCPKKCCKSKYKFPTWWNPDLSKMRAKMRFLAKKSQVLAKMLTKISAESINLQLQMPKSMVGINLLPKSIILLMSLN